MTYVAKPIPGVVYPPAETLERYVENGVLEERSLAEAFFEAMDRHRDATALSWLGGAWTYAELDTLSDRFAAALFDLGLEPLDRIVFQVENSPELVAAILACWKADLIPVCTLAAHRDAEIGYLAQHSGARAHFIGVSDRFDYPSFARKIQAQTPSLEHIVVLRGEGPGDLPSMTELAQAQPALKARARVRAVKRDPYQVTVFQLSGGTTSVPKIIPRFSNEYLFNMEALAEWEGYRSEDVMLVPLQIIHNAMMACYLFPLLLRGGEAVVPTSNDPAHILQLLAEKRPTIFALAGPLLDRVAEAVDEGLVDLSRARAVFSLNAARQISDRLGVCSLHLYGMSEGLIIFGRPDDPEEARHTTVGRPVSVWDEVRLVRPGTTEDVALGETGELITRGPYTFHGYFDAPDRNAEVFTPDGFYRSGDLMSARMIDGEIYYAFEGRLKDLISRGGEKINCEEVEHAARRHPCIADIAIVPMPDPDYDERACAFVIPVRGRPAPDVEGLRRFLIEEGLAKFKCPERIEVVEAFPLTASAKLSKPKLKEKILAILAEEAGRPANAAR